MAKSDPRDRRKSLFNAPSATAGVSERADYLELLALRNHDGDAALQDLIEIVDRAEGQETDDSESEVDEDRQLEAAAAEALDEHSQRVRDLGPAEDLYPYTIDGDLLSVREDLAERDESFLYWFLLFCTRLNMRDDRTHGGLDGAQVFERLSLHTAIRYWGGLKDSRVGGLVFGTARETLTWIDETENETKFAANVNHLCKELGEGVKFRAKDDDLKLVAKDDKLDVVVWRDCSDGQPGKLIGFGQCKTGSNWINELPRLQPESFCKRWWHNQPVVLPVKLFFLADRITSSRYHLGVEAGVLLDRCRILEYSNDLPEKLLRDCATWTRAAMKANGITFPAESRRRPATSGDRA